ncbi:MAG: tetratricopeptide repeat protein [Myxococcota bacterium]|nr:tetratricopeptide repeat protein [Myxococcota bacterium]
MASQTVSHLLGTLQQDPDNDEALQGIAALAEDGSEALDRDSVQMLDTARKGHDQRAEYRAVAQILDVEARVWAQDDPDRASTFLKELGRIYREELLDDARAKDAYERALELRPGDDDVQDAITQIDQAAERWSDFARRFIEEAESASDNPSMRSSLLVSAASLIWKYKDEAAEEVDDLFRQALAVAEGDARATRLYEQVLRQRSEWNELVRVLLEAAEKTKDKEHKAQFFLRAARVLKNELEDPSRAAASYERVLDYQPGQSEAMSYLAAHFTEQEDWDHLVALYEDALRSRTKLEDEAGALLQIGMVQWRFRDAPEEAEPYFARLRKMDPAHPGMLDFYRAHLAEDPDRWVTLLTDAQRVATTDEQKLQLAIELAKAAQESGSTERAIDAWKIVLRADPTHPAAPEALKALYEKTEKWNALVEVLKGEADRIPDEEAEKKIALLRQLVPIYRDKLGLDVMVINTWNAILQLDPNDDEALEALAATYESTGRWNDLIKVLEAKADASEDAEARVSLYMRVANLWIERFANYNKATAPLEKVIEVEPEHREALASLKEIYRKKRAWSHLYDVLSKESQLASDPEARLTYKLELAELAGKRLHRHADAIELWKEILEQDPDNGEALDHLEKLAEREKDWPTLASVLERRVSESDDDKKKVKTLQKLGVIYGEHLDEAIKAASAWKRILDIQPKNGRALRTLRETFVQAQDFEGLEALYAEQDDWEGLVDVLGNAAEKAQDDAVKVDLSFRAAAIYEERLEQPHRAFRSYERVLGVDPQNERAARALIPIYERDEKHQRMPALYEVLYGHAERDADRLALLDTLRRLSIEHLSDEKGAYGYAARAFELAPTEPEVRDALLASAESGRMHAALVELLQKRLTAVESEEGAEDEQLWLRRRIASVAGEQLGESEQAVEQLEQILAARPDDEEAAEILEGLYRAAGQHDALRKHLLHRVEHTSAESERLRHLRELARLEEDVLEDHDAAASRYRQILDIDAADAGALAALDRLALAGERWEELAGIIERRREVAESEDARRELTLRLGEIRATALEDARGALEAFGEVVRERPEDGRAIAGLELVSEADPSLAPEAGLLLEDAYEAVEAWEKLALVLKRRLDATEDPDEKRALRLRYADLVGAKTGDAGAAYQALERAFLADPADPELQDRVIEAAEAADAHEALAAAFRSAMESESLSPDEQSAIASKVAHLYDVVLARPEEAEPFHRKVLANDPLEERSFGALKELFTNAERWEDLKELYRRRIEETVDAEQKLDLLLQVCFLFEELIDDPGAAIQAYQDVLELDPEHTASRRALERLYERTERWSDLVVLLRQELDRANPEEQVGLTQRLGLLHEKKLGEPGRAVDHYEQVLSVEPNHKHAREALERLVDQPEQRQRCARILEPIYEERGDWPELVGVLEVQLEDVSDPGSKVGLLTRIAGLQEDRLHDPTAAFASVARAVKIDPADGMVREELARLARMRDAERERAEVLAAALEQAEEDRLLAGELLLELATLWDEGVGDVEEAEKSYRRLIEVDPDNPDAVLAASRALERIHLGQGNHAALASDLERQVRLEHDVDVQRRLLVRLADLREEVLEDVGGAIDAHRRRLELDPVDVDAMKSLERLYEQQGRWNDLIEVLRQRDAAVTDADQQKTIAKRVGAIYEDRLEDLDNAIVAYNDVLGRFDRDAETLTALSRLYEQTERWQDLLEVAEMVYETVDQPAQRAAVRFQMGEIMRTCTGEVERAVEAYGEVLEVYPDHEGALESLRLVMTADGTVREAPVDEEAETEPYPPEEDAEAAETDADAETEPEGDAEPEAEAEPEAGLEYDLHVRIEAARVLVPRFEMTGDYASLLTALLVLAESDDPLEKFRSLRRAAEAADVGLEDASRSFELMGRAIRAGIAEDDLGVMLRDFRRLADQSERYAEYAGLLKDVAPEILDGDLQVYTFGQIAEVARTHLSDADMSRRHWERVLEVQPDNRQALDALEALTAEAGDHPALLEVLRRKTELADGPDERVSLLLRRAEICETRLEELPAAIDCYEQALGETRPREAYEGLERLYAKAERWPDLSMHYERMLDEGVGDAVELRHKLGVTQLDRLEDAWAAIEQFSAALQLDVTHQPSIEALERLMEREDHRAQAAEILEPVFLQQMAWPKVTACLEARIAAEADVEERKAHLQRLGQIHEDYLEDLDGALESYARLFREDPRDEGTWETLARLARVLEKYDRLAEIYEGALEDITVDDEQTAKLAVTAAQIHDQRTGDLEAASRLYARALRFEPGDHGVFVALESVLERREAWDTLLTLYREQAQVAEEEQDRIALLRKSARLLEGQLGQPDRAIETYRDILVVDPEDPNAIAALDELLTAQERWPELADHLRHQVELASGEPDENDLKLKLGETLQHRLEDVHAAIDVYEEITQDDPHHTDTVAALEKLVQQPEHQLRIIQILEPIYLATDQWRKRIAIYEAQVEAVDDPYDKVRLLSQIAELHETRSQDMQLAFHAWARAMAVEPPNQEVRDQVDRLANELGTWDAHVAAYEQALTQSTDPSVQSALLGRIARVHDEKRGDPRSAIETYERLLEVDLDDPSPLDSLEALHTMVGDWRGLVDVLQRKTQRAYDPAERGELLRRAGSVLEELLQDRSGAVEAYRQALVEDEMDDIALEALDRLYTAAEDHERLGDVLQRRLDVEQDPELRVDLALRLGREYDEHLRRPEDAIDAYRRVLDDAPQHADAALALARLYERQRMWPELLDNLRMQAATQEDPQLRVQLLFRAGEVLEREMDDVLTALPTYEEVLQLDSHFEPAIDALLRISKLEDYRVQASEIVEPLLRTQERWDELAELLEGKVSAAYDPEDKRVELRRLAEVHELGRHDKAAAFRALSRALAEDPADGTTADDIERIAAELGQWDKAADVFAERASSVLDPDTSRALYNRLARIAEQHLEDDARAVEAYTRAIEQAGDDPESLSALDRLYTKMQAWSELGEILDRRIQASMDPAERSELLVRLGTLKQEQFADLRGAFRAFQEVLDRDASEPRAVAAMESLLEDDELAPDVVEVLEPVYRQTEATEKVAALYDVRIHLAETTGERVRFLQDQALVYENELGDAGRALDALRRAFELDPRDEVLAGDLERLAPTVEGGWESLRGLIERVLEKDDGDMDRMAVRDLNMRGARWYRDHLGDLAAAEARYRAAVTADPDTREAHENLVALLRAPGREEELLAALVHWAEVDFDEDAKKERLREAAAIAESALGKPERAAACFDQILDADPTDAHALDALVRLEGAAGNHARVAELLERRVDVEMDPERRVVLRKQLAGTFAELGRTEDSIEAWRGALDEEPTDLESIGALEALYETTERWSDLEELVQRRLDVAETPADRIAARVRLARLMESRFGRREEAMDQLREILEEDPGNADALDELERLHTVGEEWDELVELLERRIQDAQAAGDGDAELDMLVRLASVHVEQRGDAERGIGIYGRVLERDPQHGGALTALVALNEEREDWPAAVDALERLEQVQQGEDAIATARKIAGLAEERLEDAVRAEAALRRAFELDGGTAESREALKAHYEKHGMAEKLAMMLTMDEAETEDPREKVALLKRIADLYAGPLSDPGSAAQYLERASQIDPEDRDVLLPLCDLYIAAGRQQDAIPVLEQIVASYGSRRNKEVAVYHHRLGRAKESMGDLEGAMESYDAAFKIDLTNVQVLTDLGRLCLTRGDLDRAQKTFRALLLQKLQPEDGITKADVYFYLGSISSKQGDDRKAISMLERALAEDSEHAEATALLGQLKG